MPVLKLERPTDVVILCGGYGTRIKDSLPFGTPKALADINGTPFLHILLTMLKKNGFAKFVVCTGNLASKIHDYSSTLENVKCSFEGFHPIGTWGAIMGARRYIRTDPFLVLNGDTYCRLNYGSLIKTHQSHKMPLTVATDFKSVPVGAFVMSQELFTLHPRPVIGTNIETMIEKAKACHQVFQYVTDTPFFDIGTKEGLEKFRRFSGK